MHDAPVQPKTDSAPQAAPIAGVSPPFQRLDQNVWYPYTFRQYLRRIFWNLVATTLFRYSLPHAFRWRRWLLRRFGAEMASHTWVRRTTNIFYPWQLRMDEWSNLAAGVTVYNLGPVHLGTHTVCSQGVYLCAGTHDYSDPRLPLLTPPIRIGNGVWIAADAFIGPNVTVGDNAVVGARAVVMSDVPPGMVVAGNPARVIKPRPMQGSSNEAPTESS